MNWHQPEMVCDETLARLHAAAARLRELVVEAETIRVRCSKAREANVWPERRPASRFCPSDAPLPRPPQRVSRSVIRP
jgi:hypothetical protein